MGFFIENCGRYILLTQGQKTLVDPRDYYRLNVYKWFAWKSTIGIFYARRSIYTGTSRKNKSNTIVNIAREIITVPKGLVPDHINRNPLDNRRKNLRVATRNDNARNKNRQKNASGYLGVYRRKNRMKRGKNPWYYNICVNGANKSKWGFATEIEAARARDTKARELHGQFAVLNFPEEQ